MTTTAVEKPAERANFNAFMARVYLLMFVGLAVTGLVSFWVGTNLKFQWNLASNPWIGWGLLIVQVIVVIFLSARITKMSPVVSALLFLAYAALVGLSISSIFLLYSDSQLYSVFFITSATFLLAGLAGLLIKRDMSGFGHFMFMLLLGWILAWLASWFFGLFFGPFTNINWALNYAGIAIFVGLTAWDTQRMKQIGQHYGDKEGSGGLVVIGALQLYLDYINLFLLILRTSSRS